MTAQIHESLFLDGEQTSMACCPPIPEDHPRVLSFGHEAAMARNPDSFIFSTACWRGYLGTWGIMEDKLFLLKVVGVHELDGEEPLLADWFSGELRVPRGELLQYHHMGFASVHEQELIITIEKGQVTERRLIDNREQMAE